MRIKYNLNQTLRRYFGLAFIFCLSFNVIGQISGAEIKSPKEKKEKTKTTFNADSLSGSVYYLSGLGQYSFRQFEDQSVYGVHAKLNDEEAMYTGGVTLGLLTPLTKRLSLDAGITYFGNGEAYNYSDEASDSTFSYTNVYTQVGVPLKLRYTYGGDFQVFGFAGVMPLNILNIRNKINYTTADGIKSADTDARLIKSGFTTFNVMASGGIGVNYYLNSIGFSVFGEYRRHLLNTYSEDTFRRTHKMYGLGLNVAFLFRL